MDQATMITRRKALAAAGALGATAALTGVRGVQAATTSGGEGGDRGVQGTWILTITSVRNSSSFIGTVAFAGDGALVAQDSNGPSDIGLGAWERDGAEGFRAVFLQFSFDAKGNFQGTATIRPRGMVEGDRIHGTYTVDITPAGGGPSQRVDNGTFMGHRLEP